MTTPRPTRPAVPASAPVAPLEASNPAGPPEGTEPGQAGALDGHATPTAPGDTEVTATDLGSTTSTISDEVAPTPHRAPAGPVDAATVPRTCPEPYCNQSPGHTAPHGWVQQDAPPSPGMG